VPSGLPVLRCVRKLNLLASERGITETLPKTSLACRIRSAQRKFPNQFACVRCSGRRSYSQSSTLRPRLRSSRSKLSCQFVRSISRAAVTKSRTRKSRTVAIISDCYRILDRFEICFPCLNNDGIKSLPSSSKTILHNRTTRRCRGLALYSTPG